MIHAGDNPKPTSDFVFRKLFGSEENKDLLISLINSIVEPNLHLTDVVLKNPFNLADYKGDKESVVDVNAQDQNGTWYDIEMQVIGQSFYGKRAIYYAARAFTDQLAAGQHYSALNTTIGIHFLDFDLFLRDDRIARRFVFQDAETGEPSEELKDLQLYFVEMGKFRKSWVGWSELQSLRDRWVAFLTRGESLHGSDLPSALLAEPMIAKAVRELERMGADPTLRAIYVVEEEKRMANIAELHYARQEGIEQGIERGIEDGILRGQQRMVLRLMSHHIGEVPANVATRLAGLNVEQLEALGEALFDFHSYADVDAWLSRQ